jgi:dipeptidase D
LCLNLHNNLFVIRKVKVAPEFLFFDCIKISIMSNDVRALQPAALWSYFADLNAVPRASKKEEKVRKFIFDFGKSLHLQTSEDETGNIIIRKPGTPGMENRETIMMQSHLDMVHQKNSDVNFNFDTQGIEMFVDGDWVRAKGTTLGADNGIGVATIMALLASSDIAHPPIEALFTIDEETGMTGALGLKPGMFTAKYMLNLDTEDDRELTIGCAGGLDITATGTCPLEAVPVGSKAFQIMVKGLTGGHSGMDIHLGRGNANKIMSTILKNARKFFGLKVASIDGGSLRNAIPRESVAVVIIPENQEEPLRTLVESEFTVFQNMFADTDPALVITFSPAEMPAHVMEQEFMDKFLEATEDCHNGVYRMSPDIEGLVQTSNNLARVLVKEGIFTIMCLTRSSVDLEKRELAQKIEKSLESLNGSIVLSGEYPGWTPLPESSLVTLMSGLYREMFQEEPLVNACHAGLECGIVGANYPGMEMISFGPNITGAHSPDEKVQISSVQKYWKFLLETLLSIPEKKA